MAIPESLREFWSGFEAVAEQDAAVRFHSAFYFHDCEESANALGRLVVEGTKRATTGLLWSYEAEEEPLPVPGSYCVVTNWVGEPLCVIECTAVRVVPFEDVTAEYAAREGEGDKSLRYWREAHREFFERECARLGKQPGPRMPVVCEEFDVVYEPES